MRRSTLLLVAALLGARAEAQTPEDPALQPAVERYIALAEAHDMKGVLDMVHPVVFNMVSKEVLLEKIEQEQAKGMDDVRFTGSKVTRTVGPLAGKQGKFARVDYSFTSVMPLERDTSDTGQPVSEEEQSGSDAFVLSMMEEMYGGKNVSWDPSTRMLSIHMDRSMYAILDPVIGDWRFLEKKEDTSLVEQVIPKDVLKKLNK